MYAECIDFWLVPVYEIDVSYCLELAIERYAVLQYLIFELQLSHW